MKMSTFEKRAKKAGLNKNSIAYKSILRLMTKSEAEIYPNISTRNRYNNHTDDIIYFAEKMGLGIGQTNTSPRGGIQGTKVFLTAKGKKQVIK